MIIQSSDHCHLLKQFCANGIHRKRQIMDTMPVYFDPETISLLKKTLDEAWASLPPDRQDSTLKTTLAARMLKSAAKGERDRERLLDAALMDDVPQESPMPDRSLASIIRKYVVAHQANRV
jgi:hypothetical protein